MIPLSDCHFRRSTSEQHRWKCTCSTLLIPRTVVTRSDCQVCPVANGMLLGVPSAEFLIDSASSSTTRVGTADSKLMGGQSSPTSIATVGSEVIANWPRHLIYHLYPIRGSVWRENVEQLRRRIGLLNGRRIVSIVLDETTEPRDILETELADLGAEIRYFANNTRIGEAVSLLSALAETIELPGVTFYAHAKGVSHTDASVVFGIWAKRMYSLLDRFADVTNLLSTRAFCGLVRSTGQPTAEGKYQWHYPGSFYWFRNDVVAGREFERQPSDRFYAERFPSNIAKFTESAALDSDLLHGNPYLSETWRQFDRCTQRSPGPDSLSAFLNFRPFAFSHSAAGPPSTNDSPINGPWLKIDSTTALIPRPKCTDPPILKPAKWSHTPTRHLIFHLWPSLKSSNWRWNVEQLKRRIELFNGLRSIGVATGPETASLHEVQNAFGNVRIDHWIEVANEPLTGEPGQVLAQTRHSSLVGEGLTFQSLLNTLPTGPEHVTFYGHGKGCRYADRGATTTHSHPGFPKDFFSHSRRWGEMMYRICLDHWSEVHAALRQQPMAGGFKRYDDFNLPDNWHWHYSGTFFWFRNEDVFARPQWRHLHPQMYGQVEAWPAGLFQAAEVACLFGDAAGDLYHVDEVEKHEKGLRHWPADERRIEGVQSDREYYEVESEYRGHKWAEMLGVNRISATLLRDMGCHTILDVGSGLGAFLLSCQELGLQATGFDASRFQRDFALTKGVDAESYRVARVADYQIERPVDAIYCCEVFEHCTDEELAPLASQFAANCRWLYFTSTPHYHEGDDVNGHINVKSRDQWITFFSQYGLTFDRDDTSIVPWGTIFRSQRP